MRFIFPIHHTTATSWQPTNFPAQSKYCFTGPYPSGAKLPQVASTRIPSHTQSLGLRSVINISSRTSSIFSLT
jgi:hypothetical protein